MRLFNIGVKHMSTSAVARVASWRILTAVLLLVCVSMSTVRAMASTVGVLSGTISATGHKPVDHATITAKSPSGSYKAFTDHRGFFSMTGVQPDTYTVSVTVPGYQTTSVTGVTVSPGQTTPFSVTLSVTTQTSAMARRVAPPRR